MPDEGVKSTLQGALDGWAQRFDAGCAPGPDGVQLAEMRMSAQLSLRGDPGDGNLRSGARSALGVDLALQANTFTRSPELACLWLGPDEWLIVAEETSATELEGRLRAALTGQHVAVVDVSASRAALRIAGGRAREVLAKACSLDLHPRAFRAGQCAQSNFARAQGLLALESDAPIFHLFVRRSFAAYIAEWLLDAMREYRAHGSVEK